jgi:hypothetical protein
VSPAEAARLAAYRARLEEETYARLNLDDRGFRPTRPDPLTTGAARQTGVSARAARRSTAVTKWEYEEWQAREAKG